MKKQIIKYLAPIGCLTIGVTAAAPCIACGTTNVPSKEVSVSLNEQDYITQTAASQLSISIVGTATTKSNLVVNIKARQNASLVNIYKVKVNGATIPSYSFKYYFDGSDNYATLIVDGTEVTGDVEICAYSTVQQNLIVMTTPGKCSNEWHYTAQPTWEPPIYDVHESLNATIDSIMELRVVNCQYKNIDELRQHVDLEIKINANGDEIPLNFEVAMKPGEMNVYTISALYDSENNIATLPAGTYDLTYTIKQDNQTKFSSTVDSDIELTLNEYSTKPTNNDLAVFYDNPTTWTEGWTEGGSSQPSSSLKFWMCNTSTGSINFDDYLVTSSQFYTEAGQDDNITVELPHSATNYFFRFSFNGAAQSILTKPIIGYAEVELTPTTGNGENITLSCENVKLHPEFSSDVLIQSVPSAELTQDKTEQTYKLAQPVSVETLEGIGFDDLTKIDVINTNIISTLPKAGKFPLFSDYSIESVELDDQNGQIIYTIKSSSTTFMEKSIAVSSQLALNSTDANADKVYPFTKPIVSFIESK